MSANIREGWKAWTYNLASPVRGGDPVWDGTVPYRLPTVELDRSAAECGAGWNYCATPEQAMRVAGLWRDGWPIRLTRVTASPDAIERGGKRRVSQLTLERWITPAEAVAALGRVADFGQHADRMAREQWEWTLALERPQRDEPAVRRCLEVALAARGFDWRVRRFEAAWAARDAWAAWDAWDARDAWAALTVCAAALAGACVIPADRLTTGIRDAYQCGLDLALPAGPNELGYVMSDKSCRRQS